MENTLATYTTLHHTENTLFQLLTLLSAPSKGIDPCWEGPRTLPTQAKHSACRDQRVERPQLWASLPPCCLSSSVLCTLLSLQSSLSLFLPTFSLWDLTFSLAFHFFTRSRLQSIQTVLKSPYITLLLQLSRRRSPRSPMDSKMQGKYWTFWILCFSL